MKRLSILFLAAFILSCGGGGDDSGTTAGDSSGGSGSLEIRSDYAYVSGRYLHILGEVINNSGSAVEYVKIVASLKDNADKVVASDYTYSKLEVIPPGGKSPFDLTYSPSDMVYTWDLYVQGRATTYSDPGLEILSHSTYVRSSYRHVAGEVRNNSDKTKKYVKIIITGYDVDGKVCYVDYTYSDLDEIPPGGVSPFDGAAKNSTQFHHYEVQVQGRDV